MTCGTTTPKLSEDEISKGLSRLDGWSRGERWIEKTYSFKNFLRAMAFANAVAFIAESIDHHPDISIRYNEVTLRNWTHAVGGVTEYDLTLANHIDALIEKQHD